jgi:hypothetical protein
MAVHPAGGLVSGTLVNALLFHLGKPTIEIEVTEEGGIEQTNTLQPLQNKNKSKGAAAVASTDHDDDDDEHDNIGVENLGDISLLKSSEALVGGGEGEVDDEDDDDAVGNHGNLSELKQGVVRPGIVHRYDARAQYL